jgi:hypothetical protein
MRMQSKKPVSLQLQSKFASRDESEQRGAGFSRLNLKRCSKGRRPLANRIVRSVGRGAEVRGLQAGWL